MRKIRFKRGLKIPQVARGWTTLTFEKATEFAYSKIRMAGENNLRVVNGKVYRIDPITGCGELLAEVYNDYGV